MAASPVNHGRDRQLRAAAARELTRLPAEAGVHHVTGHGINNRHQRTLREPETHNVAEKTRGLFHALLMEHGETWERQVRKRTLWDVRLRNGNIRPVTLKNTERKAAKTNKRDLPITYITKTHEQPTISLRKINRVRFGLSLPGKG
ncbi:hypothetical protein J6590_029990 [Homalodisca vitripennis]|nr:hypothetical protein J6590_029990 [Homalodisca vitripennis]